MIGYTYVVEDLKGVLAIAPSTDHWELIEEIRETELGRDELRYSREEDRPKQREEVVDP